MNLLEELQKQIDASEKKTESLRAAYKALSNDGPAALIKTEDVKPQSNENLLGDTGVINLDDLEPETKITPRTNTLKSAVKDVILRFDKKEFMVSHVYNALNKMGKITSNEKHYKNRVSMAIRKLVDDGFLTRTKTGKGNVPHKYQEAQVELKVFGAGKNEG